MVNQGGSTLSYPADEVTLTTAAGTMAAKAKGVTAVYTNGIGRGAAGTSASGTPGTTVATITAVSGNHFSFFQATLVVTGTNTDARTSVTYTDSTTENVGDITSAGMLVVGGCASANGIQRLDPAGTGATFNASGKKIKTVTVATLNTGTGARRAAIQAVEEQI